MPLSTLSSLSRLTTLLMYFGLFFFLLIIITNHTLYPSLPRGVLVIALLLPLAFPAHGLLKAQRYTHAWTSFLSLYYLLFAIDLWSKGELRLGLPLFLLTVGLFFGCILYARFSPLPFRMPSSKKNKPQQG